VIRLAPHAGHRDLELNCVIFGDHHDAGKVFSVEISNTKPISALKDAIKDKQQLTLRDIEANALKLWKVSVPVDDNFTENVQELDLKDKDSLSSVDRLSSCFSDNLVDGHVHIIVLASPFCECN
jgi:Crinkler effector protein N-terminal domain